MPVFRKDKSLVLFIHIPKTGGSSIEEAFRANGWAVDYLDGQMGPGSLNRVHWCTPQHWHSPILRRTFRLDRFSHIFTVVRDPIARFRSEYIWKHKKNETIPTDEASVEAWADDIFGKYRTNQFISGNHMRPQHEFLVPKTQVFKFEDGLDTVIERLGTEKKLDVSGPAPREKDSSSQYAASSKDVQLSDKLERRLKRFYRKDFAKFGYR